MTEKKYKYISFLIDPDLAAALKAFSKREERSVSWVIKKALATYLGAEGGLSKPRKPASR